MKRTMADEKAKGFSRKAAHLRQGYAEMDVRHHRAELSANFKKIVNTDCYGVQKGVIK